MAIQAAAILAGLKTAYDAWTAFREWREKRIEAAGQARAEKLQKQVDELNERLRQRAGKGRRGSERK
jgi:hypothetical protein